MPQELLLQVTPEIAANELLLKEYLSKQIKVSVNDIQHVSILKRSIDARQKSVKINLKVSIYLKGQPFQETKFQLPDYKNVSNAQEVIVVGAGPAGLFAALQLIEVGLKPIVIERGKDVRGRRRDLKAINRDHIVNEDSNYCFGEGGAGTYSDGKLYTRSKKRGNVEKILNVFCQHGADPSLAARVAGYSVSTGDLCGRFLPIGSGSMGRSDARSALWSSAEYLLVRLSSGFIA